MPVEWGQESEYSKEVRKWNSTHTQFGPPGRPYVFQEYPIRMYLAGRNDKGQSDVLDAQTAESEVERRNFESRGFRAGKAAAFEALTAREFDAAQLAAERNYVERTMSDKAQAEAASANAAAGARHLASVPETPIVRRRSVGRPKKSAEPVAG